MQYVLKNLSGFIRHYTGIFLLIVVCQIVCILLSFFSFGVYQNFRNELNKTADGEVTDADYFQAIVPTSELPEKYMVSADKYDGLYKDIAKVLGDKLDSVTVNAGNFDFLFSYSNDEIIFYEEFKRNMETGRNDRWDYGRSFTKGEYIDGDRVCIAPSGCCEEFADELKEQDPSQYPYQAYKRDDKWYVDIEGIEYECIGFCDYWDYYYIPYKNMPESIHITDYPHADFTAKLTTSEYEQVIGVYKKYFPDVEIQLATLELVDTEDIYYYNTNMWISVLIAAISAINLALIMNYILTRRRKTLAIFRITGCSANKARQIYVAEIMLILNVLFLICLVSWMMWILPSLGGIFKYMQGAFSAKIYFYIYLLYMVISYSIMNVMTARYIRRSPVELLKAR